jgi:hypothetical protein
MIYLGYFICILFTLSVTSQTSPTCMYLSTTLPFLPTLASTSPPVHILLYYMRYEYIYYRMHDRSQKCDNNVQ